MAAPQGRGSVGVVEERLTALDATFLEDIKRAGDKAAEKAGHEARKPTGETLVKLTALKERFEATIKELKAHEKSVEGLSASVKRLNGDHAFLLQLLDGSKPCSDENITGLENNLGGVVGEWEVAKREKNLVGVNQKFDGAGGEIDIDVLSDNGKLWVEVKNEKPSMVENNWDDKTKDDGAGGKKVVYEGHFNQIKGLIDGAAQKLKPRSKALAKTEPAESVKIVFVQGLPKVAKVIAQLKQLQEYAKVKKITLVIEPPLPS